MAIVGQIKDGIAIPQEPLSQGFRMQSAMVLFALEQSLGAYVAESTDDTGDIPQRMRESLDLRRKPDTPKSTISSVVQETYISELIDIAVASARQKSDHQHLSRLRKLVQDLDLFEIRNAVCHPNRPFPECYWHRMAAVAMDPSIDALRLRPVVAAFRSAQEGVINRPPDDWLTHKAWAIPNNLPDVFDHEITGLIDRKRESANLAKLLSNPRFSLIAMVGPGGNGKTALCLEVLRESAFSPTSTQWADEIVYVTAKTERLTAAGVERVLDPIESLDLVRAAITNAVLTTNDLPHDVSFRDAVEQLSRRRILLCVDNLETLLRDHASAFDEFCADLPPAWRLLVTSRVPVNGANVLTIDTISLDGAKRLAREYLIRRGGERLPEETLDRVATVCDCNPLAIRLVVDSFMAGAELDSALKQTRDSILQFSYVSLLDTLPRTAIEVLECLFGVGEAVSRSDIGYLLGWAIDQVADALTRLLRTSLITRHVAGNVEKYSLSSSVRDLLLRFPKDHNVRTRVNERLCEQRQLVGAIPRTADVTTTEHLAWNYLPLSAPDHVKAVALKVFRALRLRASDKLIALLDELQAAAQHDPDEAVLFRASAHVLKKLNDPYGAASAFRRACGCASTDVSSILSLAELLRDQKQHDDAQLWSAKLIEQGWDNPEKASIENVVRVIKVHWVVAIWLAKCEEARRASTDWRESGILRPTWGCIYVDAIRRSQEGQADVRAFEDAVNEMLDCIDELFSCDGYAGATVHEAFKVIEEIVHHLRRRELSHACNMKLCTFADTHIVQMCTEHREWSIDDANVRQWLALFAALNCGGANPLLAPRWVHILEVREEDPERPRYISARVYSRPTAIDGTYHPYLFAAADDGTEYFVGQRCTSIQRDEFAQIEDGETLFVLPADEWDEGKTRPVKDAFR
jgi:hypothetical protein